MALGVRYDCPVRGTRSKPAAPTEEVEVSDLELPALVLDRTPKAIAAADGVGYRVGFRAPEAANESAKKKCTSENSAPTRRPADCFCTNAVKSALFSGVTDKKVQ